MHHQNEKLTAKTMQQKTQMAYRKYESVLAQAQKLQTDPEKAQRLAENLCKVCYYSPPRIGGAAMTSSNCAICNKEEVYGSTNTDALCKRCAQDKHLCKRCGSDLDLNVNRTAI